MVGCRLFSKLDYHQVELDAVYVSRDDNVRVAVRKCSIAKFTNQRAQARIWQGNVTDSPSDGLNNIVLGVFITEALEERQIRATKQAGLESYLAIPVKNRQMEIAESARLCVLLHCSDFNGVRGFSDNRDVLEPVAPLNIGSSLFSELFNLCSKCAMTMKSIPSALELGKVGVEHASMFVVTVSAGKNAATAA
jgi:hypothetical protein